MKSGMKLIVAVALIGLATTSNAQRDYPGMKNANRKLQLASIFSGHIVQWESNDDFAYCGFYLQTSFKKYQVNFSPGIGSELASWLKLGDTVAVNAIDEADSIDGRALTLVSVSMDGKRIYNRPHRSSYNIPAEDFIYGSSKITSLQKNKQGQIKGIILDDKTILRLSPGIADQLDEIATVGEFISYSGYQILRYGEFATVKYTIVHCVTITIDGKQYLII